MKWYVNILLLIITLMCGACGRGSDSAESAAMKLYGRYAQNDQGVTVAYVGDYHAYDRVFNAVMFRADDSVQWRWLKEEFGVIDPGDLTPGVTANKGVTMLSLHLDSTLTFATPEDEQAYIDSMVQDLVAKTIGQYDGTDSTVFVGTVMASDTSIPPDLQSQLSQHLQFDQNRQKSGNAEYIIRVDFETQTILCFFCGTADEAALLVRWFNRDLPIS